MIHKVRTAFLTGIAALAVAGVGLAAAPDTHTVTVDLPGGSFARIEYSGDVAPKVTFAPVSPVGPVAFADDFDSTPFAALDHVLAEIDGQVAATIHRAAQFRAVPVLAPGKLDTVALDRLPPGTVHYEFVSTTDGNGGCTRSIEMTSYGRGQKPRIVSASSGNCKSLDETPAPVRLDTPVHPSLPGITNARIAEKAEPEWLGTTV
jgi:hypothetical protein